MEVPVALQTAIANAALDSFVKAFSDQFIIKEEDLEGNCGKILGTVLDIHGVPVSVMALSNATVGGIGPNEDIEGNVNLYGKKDLSEKLHLDRIPSFVIEGKVVNEFPDPKELVSVEAAIYDKDKKPLATKKQLGGVQLSLFQLQVLSEKEMESFLNNKVEILTNNTNVPRGGEVPFMVLFYAPPEGIAEFEIGRAHV